jgi:hypothetical protein
MVNWAGDGGGDSSPSPPGVESPRRKDDGRGGGETKRSTASGVRLALAGDEAEEAPAVMVLARRRGVTCAGLEFGRPRDGRPRLAVGPAGIAPSE